MKKSKAHSHAAGLHHGKAGRESENEGKAWGHGEFANMPQAEKMQSYPPCSKYRGRDLDDTITGIDKSNYHSESMAQKHISNQH